MMKKNDCRHCFCLLRIVISKGRKARIREYVTTEAEDQSQGEIQYAAATEDEERSHEPRSAGGQQKLEKQQENRFSPIASGGSTTLLLL